MLQASGATLEIMMIGSRGALSVEADAALACVLRTCSLCIDMLTLHDHQGDLGTACLGDLVPGLVSCCDTLKALHCPWAVFSALPATCPTFPRLIELHLEGPRVELDCTSPARDITADGRLARPRLLRRGWCGGRGSAGWRVPSRRWQASSGDWSSSGD
jgi:hypothetical protein